MTEAPKHIFKMKTIKTNQGYYYKPETGYYSSFQGYVVNNGDVVPKLQFSKEWYYSPTPVTHIQKQVPQKSVPKEYSLKEPLRPTEQLPATIPYADVVTEYDEDDEVTLWKGKHEGLQGFYELKYEALPPCLEDVEIQETIVGEYEVSNLSRPEEMKVSFLEAVGWDRKVFTRDLQSVVCYDDIEKLLVPDFLLYTRPCKLTSAQVYKIVRAYIKDNINSSNAVITSDYDFCFNVSKRIKTKDTVTKEIKKNNNKSYRPPRFVTNPREEKKEIFRMSWAGYKGTGGYDGYPCIEPWEANNLKEMQENIKTYLDELMEEINRPLEECEHCKGAGVIVNKIELNNR